MYKLSDVAVRILSNEDHSSPEWIALIKKCALAPRLYAELWAKYGGQLPSDVTLKSFLIAEREFNKDAVDGFLKTFRATIAFAKLDSSDTVGEDNAKTKKIMPPSGTVGQTPVGKGNPMTLPQHSLTLPLDNGMTVSIPIGMSEDTFTLFLETLQLWKKRIVAAAQAYPRQGIWHNNDHDKNVVIMGVAGEKDGETYYRSLDGTGIPASQLEFVAPDTMKM